MLVYKIMTDIKPGARVKLNSDEKERRRADRLSEHEHPGSYLEAVGVVEQTMEGPPPVALVRWYEGEWFGTLRAEIGISGVRSSALQKVKEPAGPTGVVKGDIGGGKRRIPKKVRRKKISKKRSSRKRTSRKSRRRRRR